MGTPEFSIPSLDAVYSGECEIVGVVTQPDRPRGRGKRMVPSPVKEWAQEKGLKVLQPLRARDEEFIERIKSLSPDLIVTAAYGQILPKDILDIPTLGCINVHASLLPKYRGACPIQQAILEGEDKTGITIMYMDIGMDTGDIILQREISISPDENCQSLHDRLSRLGADLLSEALILFDKGKPKGIPQDPNKATYSQKIDKSTGEIDWNMDVNKIKNHVRAYTPWPGAYTHVCGLRLKVCEVIVENSDGNKKPAPGRIVHADEENGLVVSGLNGFVRLSKIQAPGKRIMEDVEFLRGNKIEL